MIYDEVCMVNNGKSVFIRCGLTEKVADAEYLCDYGTHAMVSAYMDGQGHWMRPFEVVLIIDKYSHEIDMVDHRASMYVIVSAYRMEPKIAYYGYFVRGKLHSIGDKHAESWHLPPVKEGQEPGIGESWYNNGVPHRRGGPQWVEYKWIPSEGRYSTKFEWYAIDGVPLPENYALRYSDKSGREIEVIKYWDMYERTANSSFGLNSRNMKMAVGPHPRHNWYREDRR